MGSKDLGRQSSQAGVIARRDFLVLGAAAAVTLVAPPAFAKASTPQERSLSFSNLHTGEKVSSVYWVEGSYIPDALKDLNSVLRDHRTDEIYQMDTRLLDLLYLLQSRVGSRKAYEVISGYRSPASNELLRGKSNGVAKRSYHMQGMAIDIRLPGSELRKLQQAALSLNAGGVGYYPDSGFIHVDVGPARNW